MRMLRRPTILLAALLVAPRLLAHEVRPASIDIIEDSDGTRVMWRAPALGEYALALTPHLSGGGLEGPPAEQTATPQTLTRIWRIPSGGAAVSGQTLRIEGLQRTLTDVFVRVHWRRGDETVALLKPLHNEMLLTPATGAGAAIREYFRLGVHHIWTGYDHLLYLAGLMLLVRRPRALLAVVTAFTAAHSLTLALSVLGWVKLPPAPVEAAIALSILFVAVELCRGARGDTDLAHRRPWLVAFLFGLLHGFGFAGALRAVGLPEDAIAAPLLLFNLGIEAGQLLFVAAVLMLYGLLVRRAPGARPLIGRFAPLAIGGLAAWWLIERVAVLGAST